jgi:RNA polymerase sigma-70 factor (ECF subfamily)
MGSSGSVTQWMQRLGDADPRVREEAARQIWERYVAQLLKLARDRLSATVGQREDEHDVLQSVFKSFFLDQRDGKYPLHSRNEVARLLISMTLCKVVNKSHRHRAQCRDVRRERAGGAGTSDESFGPPSLLEHMATSEPTPAQAALWNEEFARRLALLPADLRQLVLWKMEGRTNGQIAAACSRTERTVELKLQRIRQKWQAAS